MHLNNVFKISYQERVKILINEILGVESRLHHINLNILQLVFKLVFKYMKREYEPYIKL